MATQAPHQAASPLQITESPRDGKKQSGSQKALRADGDPRNDDTKPTMGHFFRIFKYSTILDRVFIAASFVCAIAAGAATPLMYLVLGRFFNDFTAFASTSGGVDIMTAFINASDRRSLYFVYLFIAKFCFDYISMYCMRMAGIRISAAVRLASLEALFGLPINFVDKLPPGSATNTLTNVANNIQMAISDRLPLAVQGVSLIIGSYVISFMYSWQLTLAGTCSVISMLMFYMIAVPMSISRFKRIMDSNNGAAGVAWDTLKSIRTVKSLCAEKDAITRHLKWVEESKKHSLRLRWIAGAFTAPMPLAFCGTSALMLWLAVKLYLDGVVPEVSHVVIAFYAAMGVLTGWTPIVGQLPLLSPAAAAAAKCFRIIDAPKNPDNGLTELEAGASADVRFENVHFTYPSRPETEVLKGLSLVIPAGKITALVGPSGTGKSTIVALLERWYDLSDINDELQPPSEAKSRMTPSENAEFASRERKQEKKNLQQAPVDAGSKKSLKPPETSGQSSITEGDGNSKTSDNFEITDDPGEDDPSKRGRISQNSGAIFLGPHCVESIHRKTLRAQIGLVQQEPFLFNDTIFENVAKGLVESSYESLPEVEKRALVEHACKEAFADEFVRRLPDGYDTAVGDAGFKLSGGQRQRLAIARSIVKKPAILILDEATSSIDVGAEKIVQAALDRASQGRTTITIAHRLSTVKNADNIVVLKDGCVAEQGTHEELIGKDDGVYTNLVRAQHLNLGEQLERRPLEDGEELDLRLKFTLYQPNSDDTVLPQDACNDEVDRKPLGLIRSVGLFLYEQRCLWKAYVPIVVCAILSGGATAGQSFIQAKFFNFWSMPGEQMRAEAGFWALIFLAMAIGLTACSFGIGSCSSVLAAHIGAVYRQQYFESVIGKPVPWFDDKDRSVGTLTDRLSNDPSQLQQMLGISLTLPVLGVFQAIGSVTVSFFFGWKLTLVIMAAAVPLILVASIFRSRFEMRFDKYNREVFQESSKFAAESVGALRTVTAFTMEASIVNRYMKLLANHVQRAHRTAQVAMLMFAFADSVAFLATALAWWYGSRLIARGEYSILQFFIIESAIIQGSVSAAQMLAFAANSSQATAAANRILEFRGSPEVNYDGNDQDNDDASLPASSCSSAEAARRSSAASGISVEFRSVGFTYPGRSVPVHRGLSFSVATGGYAALVGPSGCGKSTAVSILARFYAPSAGAVLIDGSDIGAIPLARYRRQVALVSQEPALFEGSVRENLVLGLPRDVSDDEVVAACRAAEVHGFVTSLEAGYGTMLSAGTHAGLSGGQKQRLCIARALLRRPRLLLLDEATSSLDSQSEALVQRAIENVAAQGSVTVVVVAHRLATVQGAGKIIVLGETGRVVEEGSHAELVRSRGVYWGMCRAQALDR